MKRAAVVPVLVGSLLLGHAGCSSDDNGAGSDGGSDGGSDINIPSTEFEKVTITPQGGTHEFAAGFTVVVPAGAVEQDTEIEMRLVGSDELRPIYEEHGLSADVLLAAVEGKPDGLSFKVPVTVTMKATVEPGDFPVVYTMDLTSKERSRVLTTVMADPDNDLVELTMHHFSPPNATERQKENEFAKKECEKEPCKCKKVKQTTDDKDYLCGNSKSVCQIVDHSLTVEYPDCGTVHKEREKTVSAGCEPQMTLETAAAKICPNKDTGITAYVNLGCPSAPAEGQTVEFSAEAPAKVSPASAVTNTDGVASTTLTAGPEEGTAQVSATATVEYYGLFRTITYKGETDIVPEDKRTADVEDKDTVEVGPSRWTGSLTYHATQTSSCIIESADYSGSFNIEIDCEESWVTGTATMSQSVSVNGAACEDISISNINAPASRNLMVDGEADDYLHMDLVRDLQYTPFYTYDVCGPGGEGCEGPLGGVGVLSIGYLPDDQTEVPLKAGSYNGSWTLDDGETTSGSYTIDLQEAD